jgi:hypothetical protein
MSSRRDAKTVNLRAQLSPETIRHLCAETVRRNATLPKATKKALDRAIRGRASAQGKPVQAADSIRVPVLTELESSSDKWLSTLIGYWEITAGKVIKQVGELLADPALAAIQDNKELAAAVHGKLSEVPLPDIELAVLGLRAGLVTQDLPADNEELADPKVSQPPAYQGTSMGPETDIPKLDEDNNAPPVKAGDLPPPLDTWLGALEATAPDDGVWDSVAGFVAHLSALSNAKLEGRKSSARSRLARELEQLYKSCTDFPASSEIPQTWNATNCPDQEVHASVESVSRLHDAISRFKALETRKAASLKNRAQLHREVADVLDEVHELVTKLDPSLGITPLEPVGLKGDAPEQTTRTTEMVVTETTQGRHELALSDRSEPGSLDESASAYPPEAAAATAEVGFAAAPDSIRDAESVPVRPALDAAECETDTEEYATPTVGARASDVSEPPEAIISIPPPDKAPEVNPAPQPVTEFAAGFWEMVLRRDYEGAYWVAVSLEKSGQDSPMPSWLAAAVCGSNWLAHGASRVSDGLLEIAGTHQPRELGGILKAFAAGCGLAVDLSHPEAGLQDWLLSVSSPLEELNPVVQAVREFVGTGLHLTAEDLQTSGSKAGMDNDAVRAALDVANWIERVRTKNIRFHPATKALRFLTRPESDLANLLDIALNDSRDQARQLMGHLMDTPPTT